MAIIAFSSDRMGNPGSALAEKFRQRVRKAGGEPSPLETEAEVARYGKPVQLDVGPAV